MQVGDPPVAGRLNVGMLVVADMQPAGARHRLSLLDVAPEVAPVLAGADRVRHVERREQVGDADRLEDVADVGLLVVGVGHQDDALAALVRRPQYGDDLRAGAQCSEVDPLLQGLRPCDDLAGDRS